MPGRLRRYDKPGHVHFLTVSTFRRLQFFRHEGACRAFVESMKLIRERHPLRWLGYVVMPEHVHFALLPQCAVDQAPVPISNVLQELKSLSGRLCKSALREVWRRRKTLGTGPLDCWATQSGEKPFWKPRGYDFNVFAEAGLVEKLHYMHANPVRRGLVGRAEDWPWSSYRYFEFGEDGLLAMDWDGGFPLL